MHKKNEKYWYYMQVRSVRRDNSAKVDIPMANLVEQVKNILANIQQSLFDAAKQKRDACIKVVKTWDEFIEALAEKKMILAPWCDEEVCCATVMLYTVIDDVFW